MEIEGQAMGDMEADCIETERPGLGAGVIEAKLHRGIEVQEPEGHTDRGTGRLRAPTGQK